MEYYKGKPLNSSASSLSVRFDVTTEQIEETYFSDEDKIDIDKQSASSVHDDFDTVAGSSKLLYLPRLSKRSTSIDTAALTYQDSSPPSDPWKFLADIKGKITKSVEDKLTEIKSRQEEASPKKNKLTKHKENSSFSDSEDISESSISKTCGVYSTTEGPEMSSEEDEEAGSMEKKKTKSSSKKFKLLRNRRKVREGYVNIKALRNIYEIATGLQADHSDDSEVESAVDALEENDLHSKRHSSVEKDLTVNSDKEKNDNDQVSDTNVRASSLKDQTENVLFKLTEKIENITVDLTDDTVCINEVTGVEISSEKDCKTVKTYFAPKGFVDMRPSPGDVEDSIFGNKFLINTAYLVALFSIFICLWAFLPSSFVGFLGGVIVTFSVIIIINMLTGKSTLEIVFESQNNKCQVQMFDYKPSLEVPVIKEYKPLTKFEGWMNEFPDKYDPHTYHISNTQSVYVKLQGNFLRLSHTRAKIPKRNLWNQPRFKPSFTHHRIYNLYGSAITLVPEGLNKKRHWSKKYPICITLKEEQVKYLYPNENDEDDKDDEGKGKKSKKNEEDKKGKKAKKKKRKSQHQKPQIFSKLFEKDDFGTGGVSDQECQTNSEDDEEKKETSSDILEKSSQQSKEDPSESQNESDGIGSFGDELEGWEVSTSCKDNPSGTCLYLFGRTGREKEDWFRRFKKATELNQERYLKDLTENNNSKGDFQETEAELDFSKYMSRYQLNRHHSDDQLQASSDKLKTSKEKQNKDEDEDENKDISFIFPLNNNLLWFNVLIGRMMYDVLTYDQVSESLKLFIQRKLSGIRLPYFIEELALKDLYLGSEAPVFQQVKEPYTDERGLWIDLDVSYEGCFSMYVYTKLNLMKLKQPPSSIDKQYEKECSAIYNSEIEDSAETSSDDDSVYLMSQDQNSSIEYSSTPTGTSGSSGNTGKKIMKMVDKIAESKFFQKATENKYVKKAMEGVSNTDFGIKVEVKHLFGVLAVNIPPPPSDRLWYGFRPVPTLSLSAHPIVGEKNITFIHVKNWIEKKLVLEFQKVLVIPNMDDLYLPILSPLVTNKS
ncbi:testis-expressed protein 2 isoform X2 [Agrilus planipennis]|uniref:Testis-expressed protein 2 isoform X2 n=1 Tax=Agrilus planipennis TaxID=224129 RepID=A0A7F5RKB2_AGRPL|nr:testis-expressed protein 2 isoform X2 [Agrilus planipennis]